MSRHRERMGAMSLLVLFAHSMRRMFDMYFSIVRRSAACASRVSESASWMITTVYVYMYSVASNNIVTLRIDEGGERKETQGKRRKRRTLEPLLRVEVDLLGLCDLLQDLLDNYPVVVADFAAHRTPHRAPVTQASEHRLLTTPRTSA